MSGTDCLKVLAFLVIAFFLLGLIQLLVEYWQWTVSLAGLALSTWIAIAYASRRRQQHAAERAREEASRAQEAAIQRRKDVIRDADSFLEAFSQYLTPCLILDSNIWMNEGYEAFFEFLRVACRKHGYVLCLFGPQFDEIANIKKATQYGDDRNQRARLAINRVERLQKEGLLNVRPISIDSDPSAYADPLIVQIILEESRKGNDITFISDDKELRVRVRQHLSDSATANWTILEIEGILKDCTNFSKATKYTSTMSPRAAQTPAIPIGVRL